MKSCPQCSRTYTDETLNFCLDDGEWLVTDNEPATAIKPTSPSSAGGLLSDVGAIAAGQHGSESSTRVFQNTTDQTVILRTSLEAETQKSSDEFSERQNLSVTQPGGRFGGRKGLVAVFGL